MIAPPSRTHLYIAGGPGGDSIGPPVHDFIARSLGMDLACEFLRLDSINDVMKLFRAPDFAGGIITMPHKRTVIPFLDHHDELVKILGACNFVYLTPDGQLHGTNTDWVGICEAILAKSPNHIPGKIAMVYGAGGASRAAIYALWTKLKCSKIYIVNRDDQEVTDLLQDLQQHRDLYRPDIIHIRTLSQAKQLSSPHFVVSTVPDFKAVTREEVEARSILDDFMQRDTSSRGLVLDMCYHPSMTRILKVAEKFGWTIVQGFTVVAYQFPLQWKLWAQTDIQIDGVFELVEKLVQEREHIAS